MFIKTNSLRVFYNHKCKYLDAVKRILFFWYNGDPWIKNTKTYNKMEVGRKKHLMLSKKSKNNILHIFLIIVCRNNQYTSMSEKVDMLLIFGRCRTNFHETAVLYRQRYLNRNHPSEKTFRNI